MTLIIGILCKDGVMLEGNRRVIRGTKQSEEKKIIHSLPHFIVGYSGATSLMDKSLSNINNYLINGDKNKKWEDFAFFLEDSDAELKKQYLK